MTTGTAPTIYGPDWLDAIERHLETIDVDVEVAAQMLLDGAIDTTGTKVGIDPGSVEDSVITLLCLGFLEEIVSVEVDAEHESRLLTIRLPEPPR